MSDLEKKIENLEKALIVQHSTLRRLVNSELVLRAFATAVMRQPNLDPCRLLEDYDALTLAAMEKLPPTFQMPDQFEELVEPLRTSCQAARRRGKDPLSLWTSDGL